MRVLRPCRCRRCSPSPSAAHAAGTRARRARPSTAAARQPALARGSTWSACTGRAAARSRSGRAASPAAGARWHAAAPEDELPDRGPSAPQRLAARQPVLDRRRRTAIQVPHVRARDRVLRMYVVRSPAQKLPLRTARRWRARRRSSRAAAGRADEEIRRARRRATRTPCASRSSTTRPARTPTAGASRPRSCAAIERLPRAGERLERHRLQLPRRPLRPGLRGPLRRDRPAT